MVVQEKGLVKSIGVVNFQFQFFFDVLCYVKIIFVFFQVEIYFYYQQKEFVKMVQNEGIYVIVYLFFGFIGFIECNMDEVKNVKLLMEYEVIKGIVEKVGKIFVQVLLCWVI